ncbi:MAG: hypothetical protein DWQ34_12150 [Planctomycetota bacterium]|nr:MAG: hypothetical protein DWQ29_05780 [Planctomycetota bacterium]REJ92857.1 MAG: hypothetical protein DWQ34_12150 [Planctomycetota bacterium]REK28884.1 MAG: hypothetical protein DWQ41_04855 [Planctomycetota bacterium]REK39682.1 MAG: hypothetical protein DWQ45_02090 [Planctomycetota bacterium]
MNHNLQLQANPAQFSGRLLLYPVAAPAIFPHASQLLHLRASDAGELITESIRRNNLIAVPLLQAGWEPLTNSSQAPVHAVGCLCTVALHDQLPDGHCTVLLRGLSRIRIDSEYESPLPFREAQCESLPDRYPQTTVIDRSHRRAELIDLVHQLHREIPYAPDVTRYLETELSLGALCDILAHSLQLPAEPAAELLQTVDVDQRSDLILGELRRQVRLSLDGALSRAPRLDFSLN